MVILQTKEKGGENAPKQKSRPFEISVANKMLQLRNSQWELKDDKYTFNGVEIAKKTK